MIKFTILLVCIFLSGYSFSQDNLNFCNIHISNKTCFDNILNMNIFNNSNELKFVYDTCDLRIFDFEFICLSKAHDKPEFINNKSNVFSTELILHFNHFNISDIVTFHKIRVLDNVNDTIHYPSISLKLTN